MTIIGFTNLVTIRFFSVSVHLLEKLRLFVSPKPYCALGLGFGNTFSIKEGSENHA